MVALAESDYMNVMPTIEQKAREADRPLLQSARKRVETVNDQNDPHDRQAPNPLVVPSRFIDAVLVAACMQAQCAVSGKMRWATRSQRKFNDAQDARCLGRLWYRPIEDGRAQRQPHPRLVR